MADPAEVLDQARLAYADDRLEDARVSFESAFGQLKEAGDLCLAARVASVLSELHGGSLGNEATARGWSERARRLLEEVGPCVEWGYWELARMACDRPDVDALAASAERAHALALEYGDPGLEVRALADGGLALVAQGRVAEGFARLDEALAALSSGAIADPYIIGTSLCSLLSSCDRAGDVERAVEWIRLVQTLVLDPFEGRPRVLGLHCKVAFGGVLCTAGRWDEAEAALLDALGPTESRSVGHRIEATARLAEVRLHQGRYDDAAELLAPHEDAVASAGPLALVHLHRGQLDLAAGVLRQAIRRMVGDVLRGAPLVASLVEVEVARGNRVEAEDAARLLRSMADVVDVPGIHALADLAEGRVTGEPEAYERAAARGDRPLVATVARVELAEVLADRGDSDAALAEARAAHTAAERLGATVLTDRAAATLRRLGATPPRKATATFESLTARETEVLDGITRGDTNAQIAAHLYLSPKTVEHHVGRVLSKLGVRTRAEAAAVAAKRA